MSTTIKWRRINWKRLPKRGAIIAGSYRNGKWSMCSPSDEGGFPGWCDDDRTHYFRFPPPPAPKPDPRLP